MEEDDDYQETASINKFATDEDKLSMEALQGGNSGKTISKMLNGRTHSSVSERVQFVRDASRKSLEVSRSSKLLEYTDTGNPRTFGPWTKQEVAVLEALRVRNVGLQSIYRHFPTRTPTAVLYKFRNTDVSFSDVLQATNHSLSDQSNWPWFYPEVPLRPYYIKLAPVREESLRGLHSIVQSLQAQYGINDLSINDFKQYAEEVRSNALHKYLQGVIGKKLTKAMYELVNLYPEQLLLFLDLYCRNKPSLDLVSGPKLYALGIVFDDKEEMILGKERLSQDSDLLWIHLKESSQMEEPNVRHFSGIQRIHPQDIDPAEEDIFQAGGHSYKKKTSGTAKFTPWFDQMAMFGGVVRLQLEGDNDDRGEDKSPRDIDTVKSTGTLTKESVGDRQIQQSGHDQSEPAKVIKCPRASEFHCDMTFHTPGEAIEHDKSHNAFKHNQWPCPLREMYQCMEIFERQGDSLLHSNAKHLGLPTEFPCPYKAPANCKETFPSESEVKLHSQTHSFACRLLSCGQSFKDPTLRHTHEQRPHGGLAAIKTRNSQESSDVAGK